MHSCLPDTTPGASRLPQAAPRPDAGQAPSRPLRRHRCRGLPASRGTGSRATGLCGGLKGVLAWVLGLAAGLAPALHAADDSFLADLRQWQQQRARALTGATGWAALVGLHWLYPDRRLRLGSAAGSGLVVPALPAFLGELYHDTDQWWLALAPGLAVEVGEAAASGTLVLPDDRSRRAAGLPPLLARHGPVRLTIIERGGRHALRIWDAQAPARNGFAGPRFYPPARHWQLAARWQAHPPGRTLAIVDVTGAELAMGNPGAVLFEHEGQTFRLEALAEPGDEQLLLLFADRSNGRETYGAGRYLSAPWPDAAGQVRLDFNRAYNPPCAYTAFATCPLPPPENRLDLWLRAGERL